MKRQPLKNEIFSHFSLFSWEKCVLCEQEFRREKGWRMTGCNYWLYSCGSCSKTKEEFDQKWEDRKKSIRPPRNE